MVHRILAGVALACSIVLAFPACTSGQTPDCAGDAGCGPDFDGPIDDGSAGDTADGAPESAAEAASETSTDTGGDTTTNEAATDASVDVVGDAPKG
jgi:hypothetical protein